MKKDIVFVIPSLIAGGGQKSLVNLLSVIDYNQYNVDLILFNKSGLFLNLVPPQVNLIEINAINYQIFSQNLGKSVITALSKFKLKLLYNRLIFMLKNYFIKNEAVAEQVSWKNLNSTIPRFDKKYDVAIGFLEKSSIYLVVDKIQAKKKIGFIHSDYNQLGLNAKFDRPFFYQLDYLATVSNKCGNVLKHTFPKIEKNISVIENIVSAKLIHRFSKEKYPIELKEKEINILSIGRLSFEKGFDIAIDACNLIKKNSDYDIKWYLIGDGNERTKLENEIKKHGLENNFFLLGLRANPYVYLKNADIYVQPSRFEGKSIAVDEAKILQKPIVVTNFSTAKDQIDNNINGLICEMTPESLANNIISLISNDSLKIKLSSNLAKAKLSNTEEINKLYTLFDGAK